MKIRSKLVLSLLTAVLLMGLVVVNADAADKVLKVGIMGPFTGSQAEPGANIKNSILMKFQEVGNKIGDYKLEFVFIDDQGDPAKSANAYAEAIEKGGIQVGVGGWTTAATLPVLDLCAKYGVPHFGTQASTKALTDKILSDPKYKGKIFKFWSYPAQCVRLYFDFINWAADNTSWKPAKRTVALSAEETDWGREWIATAKQLLGEYGWQIVTEDYVQNGQTDFYPLLTRYKDMGVALVTTTNTAPPSVCGFIKQMREVNLKSMAIIDGLSWVGDWYAQTGKRSDGVIDMNVKWTPKSKEYQQKFEKQFAMKPSASSGGLSYDMAGFLVKALNRTLQKHGKLDKESISEVLLTEMLTGKLTYSQADGAVIMKEYQFTPQTYPDPVSDANHWFMPVIQYKDGEAYTIFPLDVKDMDVILP